MLPADTTNSSTRALPLPPASNTGHVVLNLASTGRAREILANPPASRRGNMRSHKEIYLMELYKQIWSKRAVFLVQQNNLLPHEVKRFRLDLAQKGFATTQVRTSWFGSCIRQYRRDISPDLLISGGEPAVEKMPKLRQMIFGPTLAVYTDMPMEQMDTPALIKEFNTIYTKNSANGRILCTGVKVDRLVLSAEEMQYVVKTYPQGLKSLHAQIAGLLESSSRNVISVVEQSRRRVVDLIDNHAKSSSNESSEIN